jgi:hypothetical protein
MCVWIVCVYSVFVVFCVYVEALRRADHSSEESYRLCKNDYELKEVRAEQGAVEPWMNERVLKLWQIQRNLRLFKHLHLNREARQNF